METHPSMLFFFYFSEFKSYYVVWKLIDKDNYSHLENTV